MRTACLAIFIALSCSSLAAGAPWPGVRLVPGEELRYSLFFSTRKAGRVVFRGEAGGSNVLTMDVSDRGRGQSLVARMRLDDGGVPVDLRVTGFDYWKNPVDDRYERKGGRAVWSNASEHGEAAPAGPAFYLTTETNLEIGILAAALLRADGGRLPLLPEGEARIELAGETRVTAGARSRVVRLFAISGLDLTPAYVWMDERGFFFARYDGFVSAVREGWESVLPTLLAVQGKVASGMAQSLAARLGQRPQHEIAIRGARLFDPEPARVAQATARYPGVRVVPKPEDLWGSGPVPDLVVIS
ncbi:MAG TPA: hypothetical protein VLV54_03905, partial [Thermoanaerobaculia bacterium]|nr:hypothetical protein [Thermoanaerobaculia bacterium]